MMLSTSDLVNSWEPGMEQSTCSSKPCMVTRSKSTSCREVAQVTSVKNTDPGLWGFLVGLFLWVWVGCFCVWLGFVCFVCLFVSVWVLFLLLLFIFVDVFCCCLAVFLFVWWVVYFFGGWQVFVF